MSAFVGAFLQKLSTLDPQIFLGLKSWVWKKGWSYDPHTSTCFQIDLHGASTCCYIKATLLVQIWEKLLSSLALVSNHNLHNVNVLSQRTRHGNSDCLAPKSSQAFWIIWCTSRNREANHKSQSDQLEFAQEKWLLKSVKTRWQETWKHKKCSKISKHRHLKSWRLLSGFNVWM